MAPPDKSQLERGKVTNQHLLITNADLFAMVGKDGSIRSNFATGGGCENTTIQDLPKNGLAVDAVN